MPDARGLKYARGLKDARSRKDLRRRKDLPSVGPPTPADFEVPGIRSVDQLALCETHEQSRRPVHPETGERHDPCIARVGPAADSRRAQAAPRH